MRRIAVGILAHVDSGKTTLSEAMLYQSGSIRTLGRVDHKNAFLDNFSLERARGITIFSKQAILDFADTKFTLLDTPGHVDFSAEAERTLQVLDYAILVVSATDGVQSHTQTLWKLLGQYNVPCFIFVNKMDLNGADKTEILRTLKTKFGDGCVDFSDTESADFYENTALCAENLLNQYTACGVLQKSEIARAVKRRKIFPCMFGSALKLAGVEAFLQCLYDYTEMPQYGDEFAGSVYKVAEEKGQRLTYLKVTGGTLHVKEVLQSDKNQTAEKVNQIRVYSGEKFTTADSVPAGTVCAVTGITFARAGDGLGVQADAQLPILSPVLTYKLILPRGTDAHTALEKMRILEREDPQLKVVWRARTGEIQVQLMGEMQLEILGAILADRFGIQASFGKGEIIYKETITDTVEGVGHFEPLRHYAEVHLLLKPTERNSGITFRTVCKTDLLDKNWQRLILTHLYEKTHVGVLAGAPITDMEITLVSGRAHPKHTEGGDFRQATYRAVRQGLRTANSLLLEPVYTFTLEVPQENIGRAIADIQRMSGDFQPPETEGGFAVLRGTAPVSEMHEYPKEVLQYTHGRGKLLCSLQGYAPCHNAAEVLERIGYDPDGDTENPCDSVFCAHGAGNTVKWDAVYAHMHLPGVLHLPKRDAASGERPRKISEWKDGQNLFALDKELMQLFERTYGPIQKRTNSAVEPHFTFTERKKPKDKAPSKTYEGAEYLLVDGYNVIFSWDVLRDLAKSSMEGARQVLVNILCNYQGYKKCEVILVFDAYRIKGGTREVEDVDNIHIVYTKEAETADMYIEKVTHALAKNHRVRVVTSDAMEQLIILGNGALRVPSKEFYDEIIRAESEIRDIISRTF